MTNTHMHRLSYIHTCTNKYTSLRVFICVHSIHISISIFMQICMSVHTRTCTHALRDIHKHLYICMHIYRGVHVLCKVSLSNPLTNIADTLTWQAEQTRMLPRVLDSFPNATSALQSQSVYRFSLKIEVNTINGWTGNEIDVEQEPFRIKTWSHTILKGEGIGNIASSI